MATDLFVNRYWIPMLVLTVAILLAYALVDKKRSTPAKFKTLGIKRVLLGLGGSMAAIMILSCGVGLATGIGKVLQGDIGIDEFFRHVAGYCLYSFFLLGPILLSVMVIVGIPVFLLLAWFRLASIAAALIVAVVLGVVAGVAGVLSPANSWCILHPLMCGSINFATVFVASATVTVGFALGARLPAWRNASAGVEDN